MVKKYFDDKIVASACLAIWAIIAAIILGTCFGYFQTRFFRFGPSDDLFTVGASYNINTWSRYCAVSAFLICQGFIITFVGDCMYPWINAVVLNPDVTVIRMPKIRAWILTNNMYFLFTLLQIFGLGASMAQIDLFIYSNISSLIAGGLQSAIKLRQKEYVAEDV